MMIATATDTQAPVPQRPRRRRRGEPSALLRELAGGQATVRWLLARLERTCRKDDHDRELRGTVCRRLCTQLAAQMQVEEELAYPLLRDVAGAARVLDTMEVEHEYLRQMIERLVAMDAGEPYFAAHVEVLGEVFDAQLRREVEQLFPLLQRLHGDGGELAMRIAGRRDELLAEMAEGHGPRFENEDADPVGAPPR
jgi:iron-sulfur cluster repair protein YtfE (RIC family)